MEVRIEDAGPCRKVMHVSAPSEAIASEYRDVVEAYRKAARIPGFRRGKAPAGLVERNYARDICESAGERLVPRIYRDALKHEGIAPVATVEVRDVVVGKEKGLSFKVTLDVPPEFELPKYKKISLQFTEKQIGEKEIDEALGRVLSGFARYENVTNRNVKKDDFTLIDYDGEISGKPIGEMAADCQALGSGRDFWTRAGQPELLPGFADNLIGMAMGEERKIAVRFPNDYRVSQVAGMAATYRVVLKGIRELIVPEMNDDILKRLEVESREQLREKLRTGLSEAAQELEKNRLKNEIVKFLLEKTEMDLPQSVVAQETNLAIRNIVRRIASQGATEKDIEERRDEIVNAAWRSSTDRVKAAYILNRIAQLENVNVAGNEIDARMESMAEHWKMSVERLRAELEKENGMERLTSEILAEKTLDFLLENAKIKK